jgi:hypothetical protein
MCVLSFPNRIIVTIAILSTIFLYKLCDCIIVNTLSIPRLELIVTAAADCRMLMFVARGARFPAVFTSPFAGGAWARLHCAGRSRVSAAKWYIILQQNMISVSLTLVAGAGVCGLKARFDPPPPFFFRKRHKPRPLFCCPNRVYCSAAEHQPQRWWHQRVEHAGKKRSSNY